MHGPLLSRIALADLPFQARWFSIMATRRVAANATAPTTTPSASRTATPARRSTRTRASTTAADRYYDSELARFIQPDSTVPDPEFSQAYNRYAYVYNNPLKFSDPTGQNPFLIAMIMGAYMGGFRGAAKGGVQGFFQGAILGAVTGAISAGAGMAVGQLASCISSTVGSIAGSVAGFAASYGVRGAVSGDWHFTTMDAVNLGIAIISACLQDPRPSTEVPVAQQHAGRQQATHGTTESVGATASKSGGYAIQNAPDASSSDAQVRITIEGHLSEPLSDGGDVLYTSRVTVEEYVPTTDGGLRQVSVHQIEYATWLDNALYAAGGLKDGFRFMVFGDKSALAGYESWVTDYSTVASYVHEATSLAAGGIAAGKYVGKRIIAKSLGRGAYKYGDNVVRHMGDASDIYHNFPRLVDKLATPRDVGTIVGNDGVSRISVEISGSINGKPGTFHYIIDKGGVMTHRMFEAVK